MIQLIGLYSPVPQSGKSETAKILSELGYIIHPFARPLKEVATRFIQVVTGMSESAAKKYVYEKKEDQIPGMAKGMTARKVMQLMGTDFARNLIDEEIWVNAWSREVDTFGRMFCVVADDMRFPNEAGMIRSMGGKLWRITRQSAKIAGKTNHQSEGALDHFDFDAEILNDGSIQELRATIIATLKKGNDQ